MISEDEGVTQQQHISYLHIGFQSTRTMTEKKTTRTLKSDTGAKTAKRLCNGTNQPIDAEEEVLMYFTSYSQRA